MGHRAYKRHPASTPPTRAAENADADADAGDQSRLIEFLAPPPLRIVDVGGGAGHQSIPLARAGYEVTIVDPSPAMLDRAAQVLAAEQPDVAARVRLIEASGEDTVGALGNEQFGGVLCHGVVMYLEDPTPMIDSLCALSAPGGIVSIVAKNVAVMAARHAHDGDWAAALAAFDSDRQINGLGVDTRGDNVDATVPLHVA